MSSGLNVDKQVVADFGEEWTRFDQSSLSDEERQALFDAYFAVFPWSKLPLDSVGFDAGCGTGRWALQVAPRVGHLHCIDPSNAIDIAQQNLRLVENCSFHRATVDEMPFEENSMDFGYSLGVLHHIPDTAAAIKSVSRVLKPGAPLLLYLYYAFDNRPFWFKIIWRCSDVIRRIISRLPNKLKDLVCDVIAISIYWPVSRFGYLLGKLKLRPASWPLSSYSDKSFYTMRTDALDRFGTRLEQRFTRDQIRNLMLEAGLTGITFSEHAPYWCVVGYKK